MSRRLTLLFSVLVASVTLLSACLSPTLPLPPPSRPDVSSPDENGNVRIRGVVHSRAAVFAHNVRTDQIVGQLTGNDGRYDLTMAAEAGDRIRVWQSINTEESDSTQVIVPSFETPGGTPPPPASMGGSSSE